MVGQRLLHFLLGLLWFFSTVWDRSLKDKLLLQENMESWKQSLNVVIQLGFLSWLPWKARVCAVTPSPDSSIVFCPAMQQEPPLCALDTGSAWGDAGCEYPSGTRKVFVCCKALHWPQSVREQDFPTCPLCPAQSFSRRDTATSHWLAEGGSCP